MEDSAELSAPTLLKRQQRNTQGPELRVVASRPKEETPVMVEGGITVSF